MPDTNPKNRNRKLIVNSLWRLGQILSGSGFAALFSFIYTVFLTKSDYAAYGVAFTLNSLFQLLSGFGMRLTVNRAIATAIGAGDEARIRASVRTGVRLSIAFSVFSVLVTLALSGYLASFFEDRADKFLLIAVTAFAVGAAGVSLTLQGVLEGLGEFKKSMHLSVFISLGQLVVLGALLLTQLTVLAIVILECLVLFAGVAVYAVQVRRKIRRFPDSGVSEPGLTKQMIKFATPIFLNFVGGFLYTKVDVLFVKYYLTSNDTADYFLMMYIFQFPLQALGAYLYVLNTEVSRCIGERNWTRIRVLFKKSIGMSATLGLGVTVLFIGASYVVPLVLPEYRGTAHLMRLISPMLLVKYIAQVASGGFMVSLGRVRLMAALTIAGGVLNMILNYLFIPPMGVDGAVYSTVIGHTTVGILTVIFVVRTLRRPEDTAGLPPRADKEAVSK